MPQEFLAPARVNLLGEHTDYTGGLVLPMAIPFHTRATLTPLPDPLYRFTSEHFDTARELQPADRSAGVGDWSDYPVGVLRELQARGIEPPPLAMSLRGDVPLNSGLSSSASIEVVTAMALLAQSGSTLPLEEIALLCQHAENTYVHSPCGIMDQFVIVAAKAGHALLLHTRTLAYEHIPINGGALADTRIVVCNSMVKHSVASGEYGNRRREVEAGQAAILAKYPQLTDLGEATLDHLEACADTLSREAFLRCRHIITENARVREAVETMRAGDPVRFGALMLAGHVSQRDDFAVSCPEIDFLVETATALPGCFGARLTGGGFGGCTVNLVDKNAAAAFAESLKSAYRDAFNLDAETYLCEAVDGAMLANAGSERTA
ncbi:MAG: galactokinase [Janthinobacterium lividum]